MKASNAYEAKEVPVIEIFQQLFLVSFYYNRSIYMALLMGRDTTGFAKDTVYRFMKMVH